jgi:hypothetical protein
MLSDWVHHLELGLVFRAAALGRDIDAHLVSRHHLDMEHAGRVILGVLARESGIAQHGGAQPVLRVQIGTAHALVDDLLHRARGVIEAAIHAPFDKHVDDAGVLADRAMPFRAHAAVGEDLRDRVLRRRPLLRLVGLAQRADVIHRVIIADILERIGNALDQVGGFDDGHGRIQREHIS